jgi:hypothetical protein
MLCVCVLEICFFGANPRERGKKDAVLRINEKMPECERDATELIPIIHTHTLNAQCDMFS